MDTVFSALFHSIDDSLSTLFDLRPDDVIARHAAEGFRRAGTYREWIMDYLYLNTQSHQVLGTHSDSSRSDSVRDVQEPVLLVSARSVSRVNGTTMACRR